MLSGLTNNRDTGLDLGIRASHNGIDGGHRGLSFNSNIPLLKTSSNSDGHFRDRFVERWNNFWQQARIPTTQTCGVSVHVRQAVSLAVNQHGPFPFNKNQSTDKTGMWRNSGGHWAYLPVSDHNREPLCSALAQIFPKNADSVANWPCQRMWDRHIVASLKTRSSFLWWINTVPSHWGHFTPPTTYWSSSVERLWKILSWCTICLRLRVNLPFQRL